MSNRAQIFDVTIFEGMPATFLARVRDQATGVYVTQALFTGISFSIYDLDSQTPDTPIGTGTIPASVIYDIPRVDERWNEDQVGFNFEYTLGTSAFPLGNRTYAFEIIFNTTVGVLGTFVLLYHVHVLARPGG